MSDPSRSRPQRTEQVSPDDAVALLNKCRWPSAGPPGVFEVSCTLDGRPHVATLTQLEEIARAGRDSDRMVETYPMDRQVLALWSRRRENFRVVLPPPDPGAHRPGNVTPQVSA
jgi:hypothetical protein